MLQNRFEFAAITVASVCIFAPIHVIAKRFTVKNTNDVHGAVEFMEGQQMFKRFIAAVMLVVGLLAASSSWSLLISDVGGIDEFVDSATISNSGDGAELSWIQSILGADATIEEKYDSGASEWMLLDGEFDVYAAELIGHTNYFFLKLGTGGTSLDSHYLFKNVGDLSYAVVDFSLAGIDMSISAVNVGRISHVGEVGDGVIQVSEPPSTVLLGIGLIALVVSRRRMIRA